MSLVTDVGPKRIVRLANDQERWKLDVGCDWNYIRVLALLRFAGTVSSHLAGGSLRMGLCEGDSGVGDATTTAWMGVEFKYAAAGGAPGSWWRDVPYGLVRFTGDARASKKVGTSFTNGTAGAGVCSITGDSTILSHVGFDIDRTNNYLYYLIDRHGGDNGGYEDRTITELKTGCETIGGISGKLSISSAQSLALPSQNLDTLNISWDKSGTTIDIYGIDVYRFS